MTPQLLLRRAQRHEQQIGLRGGNSVQDWALCIGRPIYVDAPVVDTHDPKAGQLLLELLTSELCGTRGPSQKINTIATLCGPAHQGHE